MTDIMGKALLGYLNGDASSYFVERDDGYKDDPQDIGVYFSEYRQWAEHERKIIRQAEGRVLDIGAGAGRHSLYLQSLGYIVHAIDISPLAVEVMMKRGVYNAYKMDLNRLDYPYNFFDTFLMMFNNFGLAGNLKDTKKFLNNLYRMASLRGRIIASIRNPYWTTNPNHLAYQKKNKEAEKPAGQLKMRLEYKNEVGDWFNLLILSPGELIDLISDTGWIISFYITQKEEGVYGVVLKKQ